MNKEIIMQLKKTIVFFISNNIYVLKEIKANTLSNEYLLLKITDELMLKN